VYTTLELSRELRQSEIITNLSQYTYDPVHEEGLQTVHPFAIILTQDCDLLWDFEARASKQSGELNGVLIFELESAPVSRTKITGSDIWKRIRQNRDDRYHILEAVPPHLDLVAEGLPAPVIDFKKYFTLPADEIYRQCGLSEGGARRRCRLEMPYREHLQHRASYYFRRVMLPVPLRVGEVAGSIKALPGPD
jgi:hypothetical protein